jgi:hypothetical protein
LMSLQEVKRFKGTDKVVEFIKYTVDDFDQ